MLKSHGLLMFSGGLDSILSVKLLQNAGADITAITFVSAFFDAEQAKESIKNFKIKHLIYDFTKEHLKIVKNPPSGLGKNLNPCIDCHALMLKITAEISQKKGFDFIATGEVLGQRPFSQNKNAFARIEKITNLKNKILRPLSALLLEETEIEKTGKINRNQLGNIQGRSRKSQLELAKKFDITKFPSPAGGCLLTDPKYSQRGKKLLEINPKATANDFEIIKHGRFFVINTSKKMIEDISLLANHNSSNIIIMIGRDKEENDKLINLAQKEDILINLKDIPGPLGLIRDFFNINKEKAINFTQEKIINYSTKAKEKEKEKDDVEFECQKI